MGVFYSHGRLAGPGELIFMLAVVGLGAWAVSGYRDYVGRAVREGAEKARPAMAAVERAFQERGPTDMSRPQATGWKIPAATSKVRSVSIGPAGVVTVQFADAVADAEESLLQLVPVADGRPLDLSRPESAGRKFGWECGGASGKTTLPPRLRRLACP